MPKIRLGSRTSISSSSTQNAKKMIKVDFYVTDVMNFDKNVKKSFVLKIESGVSRVSGGKSSLKFAKKEKNHALEENHRKS